MQSGPEIILRALDGHLTGAGEIRLFGGAAMVLGYGRNRMTEDADLLMDDHECQALIDDAGFAEAIEATNQLLEPQGLYLSHIFGPEQQVLSPTWRTACRPIELAGLKYLRLTCLGPIDLLLTKLGRGDGDDMADIRHLIESQGLEPRVIREAVKAALVPPEYSELFVTSTAKLEALLSEVGRAATKK